MTAPPVRPLGRNQLQRLLSLASPGALLVVADDAIARSLARRGLTAPRSPAQPEAFHGITPAGLRALADAFEAGKLEQFMRKFPPRKSPPAEPQP